MSFFEKNNLISNMQNGFRKNRSTLSSIVDFTSDIYKSINNKEITLAAFIDLKKAFDTVNHKILMEKLNYLGIKGSCLNWILDYLKNRSQITICNSVISQSKRVTYGVPQGSILGPLFFLVYINDVQGVLGIIIIVYMQMTLLYTAQVKTMHYCSKNYNRYLINFENGVKKMH